MIRIVGVERSENPQREAVLMQNQGVMRVQLRGHALLAEVGGGGDLSERFAHVFTDDVDLPAGSYVWVVTGDVPCGWSRTKEGYHVYRTSLRRMASVWSDEATVLHLLAPQHTYHPRGRPVAAASVT